MTKDYAGATRNAVVVNTQEVDRIEESCGDYGTSDVKFLLRQKNGDGEIDGGTSAICSEQAMLDEADACAIQALKAGSINESLDDWEVHVAKAEDDGGSGPPAWVVKDAFENARRYIRSRT